MILQDWYIKTPLVLQGAIYGFIGAVLAIVPVNFLNGYLVKMHNFFMIPVSIYSQFITILGVLLLGLFFAAGGSLMSIKKHLEV